MAEGNEKTHLLPTHDYGQRSSKTQSCGQKFSNFLSQITVEPAICLFSIGLGLEMVFATNLWVDKVCSVYFNYSDQVCSQLDSGDYTKQQDTVQRMTSQFTVYYHIIQYLPAAFTSLLLGSWSDKRGRRLPILVPMFGRILMGLGLTANAYWWPLSINFLLLAYVPMGLTGNFMGFFMGVQAYVSAISRARARTLRISVVYLMMLLFAPIGQALGVVVYDFGGYVAVFGIFSLLNALAAVYIMIRIKEPPRTEDFATKGEASSVCQVLSPRSLSSTVMVACRKRKGGQRGQMIGHIIIICLFVFAMGGEMSYSFLLTRKKFSWDYNTFTAWSVFDKPASNIGTMVLVPLMSYKYRAEDAMLGLVGSFSYLFKSTICGTAPFSWLFYLASVMGMCSGMTIVASRGALAKLVSEDELGAVFAVLAAGEAIIPIISSAVYAAVYNATLDIFPGMIFIIIALISLVSSCIYVWLLTAYPPRVSEKKVPAT